MKQKRRYRCYVVVNDNKMRTGNFVVTGTPRKDGVKINPNPVAGLALSLASKQAWTHEHIVNNPKPHSAKYKGINIRGYR